MFFHPGSAHQYQFPSEHASYLVFVRSDESGSPHRTTTSKPKNGGVCFDDDISHPPQQGAKQHSANDLLLSAQLVGLFMRKFPPQGTGQRQTTTEDRSDSSDWSGKSMRCEKIWFSALFRNGWFSDFRVLAAVGNVLLMEWRLELHGKRSIDNFGLNLVLNIVCCKKKTCT